MGFKPWLNKVKPPAVASDFQRKIFERSGLDDGQDALVRLDIRLWRFERGKIRAADSPRRI
jgi:hypothetical protein